MLKPTQKLLIDSLSRKLRRPPVPAHSTLGRQFSTIGRLRRDKQDESVSSRLSPYTEAVALFERRGMFDVSEPLV